MLAKLHGLDGLDGLDGVHHHTYYIDPAALQVGTTMMNR